MLCSLGDLLLDVVVGSLPPGSWAHGSDNAAVTRVRAGGQAANVAAWAVALGGRARVVAWPARLARPVDSTGAGDAFAAGFLLGGVELGLEAAAAQGGQTQHQPPPVAVNPAIHHHRHSWGAGSAGGGGAGSAGGAGGWDGRLGWSGGADRDGRGRR